ncbi:MAG: MerR family transcriptional regulator [Bacteroidales bacterium]|jgi:DNA-binding transcriptional MerR regulator|nr:MerR family transcriptional regulator [Bacteroidales bacterium]
MNENKLYYSIREVAENLNVTLPTLRFWETQFKQIKPNKNKRGVRSYNNETFDLLKKIVYLTREEGYTLEGVRNYLKGDRYQNVDKKAEIVQMLNEVKTALLDIKQGMNQK